MDTSGVTSTMRRRRSTPRLTDPAPGRDQIEWLLTAAVMAPDHGRLKPWRFVVFEGEARRSFGEVLAAGYRRRCVAGGVAVQPSRVAVERARLTRAPLVIAVGARVTPGNITRDAQVCAVAAAAQNLLLAATDLGYGTMWRSGAACSDGGVKAELGLLSDDVLLGFLYIGTVAADPPPRPEPSLAGVVRWWSPAAEQLPVGQRSIRDQYSIGDQYAIAEQFPAPGPAEPDSPVVPWSR
jgi:nitroreductase